MASRHERGVDMEPTIERIVNHVYGAFFYSFAMHDIDDTAMYSWVLGPTEHCTDCVTQAGMGDMLGSYWKKMADEGIYPKSPLLFCTGLHCQCEIHEA